MNNDKVTAEANNERAVVDHQDGSLSETELAGVSGGVKPWLDAGRGADEANFYIVERKI